MNLSYDDNQVCMGISVNSIAPPKLVATVIVKATFAIKAKAIAAFAEEPELLSGDVYNDDELNSYLCYASDFAPFKPYADVLLNASAYSPKGQSTSSLQTVLQVGSLRKILGVVGDRTWKESAVGGLAFSDPQPFVQMPITYARAYGGNGFGKNPIGSGYKSEKMPNIIGQGEIPRRPTDKKEPGGYASINPNWEQRLSLVGSYDAKWLKDCWPWFPRDFNWAYFNCAPKDQQISDYLRGHESIILHNLHPDFSVYETSLPGIRVRCFITEILNNQKENFQEIPMNLDTLSINMDQEKMNLVWRGLAEVRTLKLKEIKDVFVVTEALADEPKSFAYYREFLQGRTKKKGLVQESKEAKDDKAVFDKKFGDMEQRLVEMEELFAVAEEDAAQAMAGATKTLVEHKSVLSSQGIDPKPIDVIQAIDQLKNNPDFTPPLEKIDPTNFRKAQADADLIEKEKVNVEKEFLEGKKIVWTREKVQDTLQNGGNLVEQDLAQLDLSDLDLSGGDFAGAILFNANLQRANFVGANLRKANLNKADLAGANLSNAVLDEADLSKAILTDAVLVALSLNGSTLSGLKLAGANFSQSVGKSSDFSESDLTQANFSEAQLIQADFSNCKLDGAIFDKAQLPSAQFCGVAAQGINMENADITGLHGNEGANFTAGSFKNVIAKGAVFEESILDRVNFSRSNLTGAQFSETSLRDAVFDRVQAASAVFDDAMMQRVTFTNSNVLRATFDRVDLTDANLQGSNFFEAGFWNTVITNSSFYATNLKNTLLG